MSLKYGKWLAYGKLIDFPKLRIIMFPHAGGNATNYISLHKYFEPDIQLLSVNLPGRDIRINEPMNQDLRLLAKRFVDENRKLLEDTNIPYILAGHSMGAILAYEASVYISDNKYKKPLGVVLSGALPPDRFQDEIVDNVTDEKIIIDYLVKIGGVDNELLEMEEFKRYYFPIIISDFMACNNYEYIMAEKLDIPLHVIYGNEDDMIEKEYYTGWKDYTCKMCDFKPFEGNHFFLFKDKKTVCDYIKKLF